jgi:chitin-binding protein
LRALAVGAVAATLLTTAPLTNTASAHGNIMSPVSRNKGCLDRWGTNHLAPEMATVDPMCYQAWQANPNTMWNWNSLFREGVAGNHQGAIPDGELCSAGRTQGGFYSSLDTVGNWQATNISNGFTARIFDQASHGADYIRIYATRQGFNPITQPLRWADLELVAQIGNTPASQWQQVSGGVQIDIPVNAPGRTGRHMLYTIWQASHLDQSYYWCSDVNFGGTGGNPTTPPTNPPTNPPTTPPTTPPTNPPGNAGCTAAYTVTSTWSGGFQGDVRVTAGSAGTSTWRVTLTYPSGITVQQGWNATVTASGSTVTAANASYNGRLGAGASTTFGFIGSAGAGTPTVSCSAT